MPCLVRLSLIFFLNGTIDSACCHFISDVMDYFLAGEDQQQTNQPNDLAGGYPNLRSLIFLKYLRYVMRNVSVYLPQVPTICYEECECVCAVKSSVIAIGRTLSNACVLHCKMADLLS